MDNIPSGLFAVIQQKTDVFLRANSSDNDIELTVRKHLVTKVCANEVESLALNRKLAKRNREKTQTWLLLTLIANARRTRN